MNKFTIRGVEGPHADLEVLRQNDPTDCTDALILLHGRGASAENILRLAPDSVKTLILAPDAVGHVWYPARFTESRETNQPHLDSALQVVSRLLEYCLESNISHESVVIVGFSQGACLTADFAARNPTRYKGLGLLSGGLIGDDADIASSTWQGDLAQTPVYIGCDINDPYIPVGRVETTARVYENLHSDVTLRLYDDLGHAIHPEGRDFIHRIVGSIS